MPRLRSTGCCQNSISRRTSPSKLIGNLILHLLTGMISARQQVQAPRVGPGPAMNTRVGADVASQPGAGMQVAGLQVAEKQVAAMQVVRLHSPPNPSRPKTRRPRLLQGKATPVMTTMNGDRPGTADGAQPGGTPRELIGRKV